MDQLLPFGNWFWWIAAGLLLILELIAPGVFFMFLAGAALTVGILDTALSLGWRIELVLFAAFSLVFVLAGRPFLKKRHVFDSDRPNLNRRMYDYVGKNFVLSEPVVDGKGRLRIEDTIWDVRGPDLPQGSRVRVTGVDGMRLTVEAV